jgi:hypothetical protein
MTIPDEAIDAAAEEIHDREGYSIAFHDAPAYRQAYFRELARQVLAAAAPYIAAQTLREASDAYPLETAYGGAEHAVLWLKERATEIEQAS